ncbi:hypothetical protein PIB30_073061 [Stylosanthes scabra]|uniref:Uncharacterized protein n=1 Tax=Stylosanthes scabra TaxID=79078 RepID=A0ABU6QPD4_9FABA|nr:hypothetical protein [Stylosanthes scabra]
MASPNPNDAVMKIKAMLEEGQPRYTDECCIYRVPHEIRKHNEEAYTPKVVSIGPFHHGNQNLLNMEGHKRLLCRKFIERSETKNLESFVSCVEKLEANVRGCYSDEIKLSKEELVMVILVDCCFILELLLRYHFKQWSLLSRRLHSYVDYDLLLLENQVPFFDLDKLYKLAFPTALNGGGHNSHPSLLNLALYFLPACIIPDTNDEQILNNVDRVVHFTDLSRKCLLASSHLFQPSASGRSRGAKVTHIFSATEFNEAGVKFEINKNDKDVDLLIRKGIIENWLGDSNAVAKMFNGLGVNLIYEDFNVQYSHIFEDLNAFCAHPWNKKVATLKRDYCNTPWKTAASIAGIFLLILTIIQTIFSILQVVH